MYPFRAQQRPILIGSALPPGSAGLQPSRRNFLVYSVSLKKDASFISCRRISQLSRFPKILSPRQISLFVQQQQHFKAPPTSRRRVLFIQQIVSFLHTFRGRGGLCCCLIFIIIKIIVDRISTTGVKLLETSFKINNRKSTSTFFNNKYLQLACSQLARLVEIGQAISFYTS